MSWLEHSRCYTETMIERLGLDGSSQVIELAATVEGWRSQPR